MYKVLPVIAVCLLPLSGFAAPALPPAAPVHPVTTNYYGTEVTDNYRWTETPWHRAGMKLTKINTILDFIACARYLEEQAGLPAGRRSICAYLMPI